MGMTPLSWQDIHAYCVLFGYRFSRTELAILRLIDAAYFEVQAEERDRQDTARDARK